MDIPALSMQMSMQKVQDAWGVAMLKNSLDTMEIAGDTMSEMVAEGVTMNMANPAVGANIDIGV